MENKFSDLGISPLIIKAIEEIGFKEPTDVQSEAIPHVLNHKDLIVMSKTGSGKTGAFGLPMIQLVESGNNGPQGLILTPTRELAVQVDGDLKMMSKYTEVKTTAIYGQHNMGIEIKEMKRGASIITGTPGRVFDHILKKTLVTKNIKFLVLDEADRMLDMGFIDQIVKIIKTLPRNRVTLLFSATMPSTIKHICKAYMKDPITLELESETKTVDTIEQLYYRVDYNDKRTQLDRILKAEQPDSCMVFCNTRIAVDKVHAYLARKGYVSDSLHGANTQGGRMKTIGKFKKNEIQVLVATDVAARGIHVDDLSLVINYDVPVEKDSYVHRIGRTGRAGNSGKAITFVTVDEFMSFYEIEEHVGVLIEEEELPTDAYIQERVAKADGKWVNVKPPQYKAKAQYKKPKVEHHKSTTTRENMHKPSENTHKPSENKEAAHKPTVHKSVAHKPAVHKQPVHKATEKQKVHTTNTSKESQETETTYNIKAENNHIKKPNQIKVEPPQKAVEKIKTEIVMTKLGPIEMVMQNETTKKKSFISRMFGKK